VDGFEGPCEYQADVRYVDADGRSVDVSQLIPLVDGSTSCRQLVKWRCLKALINVHAQQRVMTRWRNRYGDDMNYWGGASPVAVGRWRFRLSLNLNLNDVDLRAPKS